MTLNEQLIEQLNKMDEAQQQRLLNFARILTRTPVIKGERGASIVAATEFFDAQSLDEMEAAIAEDCEEIDWRGDALLQF
jgi:hypothetical protein